LPLARLTLNHSPTQENVMPLSVPQRASAALLSLLLLAPAWSGAGDGKPAKQEVLEANLRKLEKEIAEVRGLAFKAPVVAKVIPRPADKDRGVQGYYSLKDKALFIYDDIKGSYERGVLVHEMVHALQDQHFNLKKLHQQSFQGDEELALAALIEGDATFTMIELLKKDQPKVALMLETPLEKSRNLQNAFLYAQGARYVKALKEKGGWQAVNGAYRFPPQATATILHPGERFSTIDLGPGKSVGEYGLIALLADHPETKALAVQAAAGWRGDRTIEEVKNKVSIVAFATAEQARRFQDALARRQSAGNPGWKSTRKDAGGEVWETPNKGIRAVLVRGAHVLSVEAADQAGYRALLERAEGPPPLTIRAKDGKEITFGEMIDRLEQADVVCVGETHDSDLHHRVQLQIIKALFARDERLGVGMEMFQRPYQKEIDRYFHGDCGEEEFLKATEYRQRWGFEWSLYRPIVEFCRKNAVPLAALNVPRELTGRLSKVGFNKLSDDEKKQLGPIDFHVKEHRAYWYERLARMHGQRNVSEEQKERSYQVMTAWDDYMAASAAGFQQERQLRRLVVLAGSGHVERGFGIPQRTARRTGGKALTVTLVTEEDGKPPKAEDGPAADFTVIVR
jgi:uncharacterized iron-regulated protein